MLAFYRTSNEPPYMKGNFFLGVAMSIAKDAVGYLRKVQKQVGDVVTMKLLYLHITFLLNPHDYDAFLNSRDLDYLVVQETAVWRLFGTRTKNTKEHLKILTKGVRGPAMEKSLENFSKKVANVSADLKSDSSNWKTESLPTFTSKTMFSSLYNNFFDVPQSDDSSDALL